MFFTLLSKFSDSTKFKNHLVCTSQRGLLVQFNDMMTMVDIHRLGVEPSGIPCCELIAVTQYLLQ